MSSQATVISLDQQKDLQDSMVEVRDEPFDITQLFASDISERMYTAASTVNVIVANQDTRFTEPSSRKISKMLVKNDLERKKALKEGKFAEANKLLETSDFLSVLLHVRKKIGNSEILSTQFSPNEIRELQTRYQYLLKNV